MVPRETGNKTGLHSFPSTQSYYFFSVLFVQKYHKSDSNGNAEMTGQHSRAHLTHSRTPPAGELGTSAHAHAHACAAPSPPKRPAQWSLRARAPAGAGDSVDADERKANAHLASSSRCHRPTAAHGPDISQKWSASSFTEVMSRGSFRRVIAQKNPIKTDHCNKVLVPSQNACGLRPVLGVCSSRKAAGPRPALAGSHSSTVLVGGRQARYPRGGGSRVLRRGETGEGGPGEEGSPYF